MTSQKRFRHQENSNAASRTRDLPPRFKRQKSSSGQTPPDSRAVSPLSPQLDRNNQPSNMTKQSNPQSSSGTAVNRTSPSQTPSSVSVRYPVFQPINYVYSDIPSTQSMSSQVYPVAPSPQMWTGLGYTGLQPVMVSPNPVMLSQPQVNHHVCDTATYMNENCAPSPSLYTTQCSPMSPWSTSGYGSPYQSSCSSPVPTIPSPGPCQELEKNHQSTSDRMKSSKSPSAQYTDPDLRTIEMLRELERVADKESQEADEGGSDRKTLVSHHLRMLMCAMDRYTENIDDSEMDGSIRNGDGLSPQSSNRSSPSPPHMQHPRKPEENHMKEKHQEMQSYAWNQNRISAQQVLRSRPVLGGSYTPSPAQNRVQPNPSRGSLSDRPVPVPQTPWVQDIFPNQQSEWNPWSSPSFNFYGVLGDPNEHFESFQDACFPANKERKPLYKR
ncbi:hypothetical protein EGW08_011422 [Elysia chlorotica]|uniref:Uncharacterized protein n=1 Tax=Elysia chlorotica TaxID=188477 RepID=A0A3S1B663_ELYCH|nr:hypothetical protein EGW08_011422 [Elysia chlorotica]